jgi:hypothetical protein
VSATVSLVRMECTYLPLHWELVPLPECKAHDIQTEYSGQYKNDYCRTQEQLRHLDQVMLWFEAREQATRKNRHENPCKHFISSMSEQ